MSRRAEPISPRRRNCERFLQSVVAPKEFPAVAPEASEANYYRTSNGTEVDLVLTLPGGKPWAIEIKRSSAPKVARGFHSACADLKPSKRFVVYPGEERFSLDDEIDAISVTAFAEALQSAQ